MPMVGEGPVRAAGAHDDPANVAAGVAYCVVSRFTSRVTELADLMHSRRASVGRAFADLNPRVVPMRQYLTGIAHVEQRRADREISDLYVMKQPSERSRGSVPS